MRFLLDTHTFLWYTAGSDKLSKHAFQLLDDTRNQPVLSTASLLTSRAGQRGGKKLPRQTT